MLPRTYATKMAADSNMGVHHGVIHLPFHNRHMLSFRSGTINTTTGMASGGMGGSSEVNSGMFFSGNPSMINNTPAMVSSGPSSSNTAFDPIPGVKQDTVLTPKWTLAEQNTLNEGLVKYAAENSIMKYVKIAAMLRRKTVRDVAMRCRWMANNEIAKRRKLEEHYAGKKMKDRKEKMVDLYSNANTHMAPPENNTCYSPRIHHVNQDNQFSLEALDGAIHQLMDENAQVLSEISTNLATFKMQENIDLFLRTRNNITAILNNMSNMPGIMHQMHPLPVSVNEELLNTIVDGTNQAHMFGAPGGVHFEQQGRF